MAKKRVKQAEIATPTMPPPEVRFELSAGLPKSLPAVGKPITLQVSGTLSKVAMNEYGDRDTIAVRKPKVTVKGGK